MSGADLFFVDSNVPLYYVDRGNPQKRQRATEWLDQLWASGAGRLSWQVLHEFYSNATRKMRVDRGEAREIAEQLAEWQPIESSLGLIREAWEWADAAQLSYWDALIVAAAERSGARYLLTEGLQAERVFENVQVIDPFRRPPSEFSWRDLS